MAEEKIAKRRKITKVGLVLSLTGFTLAVTHLFVDNIYLVYIALAILVPLAICFILLHKGKDRND